MVILGLAGHVDHGKTALVRALTGIDTDRLPEEKARGMTTDLGFARFRLNPDGATLEFGVIDVPGHERYIRNMAAGAWALDLVLFVVAADDGWMEQTENHARILSAFGPPRIILVVTKADKVDESRTAAVAEETRARALAVFGPGAIAAGVAVSAHTGTGMDLLLKEIAREGRRIEAGRKAGASDGPGRLFVDRIFTRSGAGLVACGTLLGGPLGVDEEVLVLPSGESLRVKSMESLGGSLDLAAGPLRLALNLSKPREGLRRGDLILAGRDGGKESFCGTEFLLKVEALPHSAPVTGPTADPLRKGGEIEVAAGSADRIGSLEPLGKGPWYRFHCGEALALPRGLPLAVIRQGGAEVLARAVVLRAGKTDRALRKTLSQALAGLETLGFREAEALLRSRLEGAAERAQACSGPPEAARTLPEALLRAEAALRKAGLSGIDLSPTAQGPRDGSQPGRKDIEALCAAGLAVPLDHCLFFHREAYAHLVAATLQGLEPGASLDLAEAKLRTGFSRKYVIPFLNRMERDGFVRREGERRMVLSLAGDRKPGG